MGFLDVPKKVDKIWGREIWHVNTNQYCEKTLEMNPGYICSFHRHVMKDETFRCTFGTGYLQMEDDLYQLTPATPPIRIFPGKWHRFFTFEGMTLKEVSTTHDDADVERRMESGRISWPLDLSTWYLK